MRAWNVPKSWGKWLYLGTISVLLGVINILGLIINDQRKETRDCRAELKQVQEVNQRQLWEWANKAFDQRYEEKKGELTPRVEELKAIVDSIKNKKL